MTQVLEKLKLQSIKRCERFDIYRNVQRYRLDFPIFMDPSSSHTVTTQEHTEHTVEILNVYELSITRLQIQETNHSN